MSVADTELNENTKSESLPARASTQSDEKRDSIIDTLSSQQKVVALLVALGKPTAARLLKHFSTDDLRLLSGQAHKLPDISLADFEILVRKFEDAFAEGASFSQAGERFNKLVLETLPEEEVTQILNPPIDPDTTIWDIFNTLDAGKIHAHLEGEHPQIIAYILSRLPSDLAARLLLAQNSAMRADITRRTLHLGTVSPLCDQLLNKALHPQLTQQKETGKDGNHTQVASMLNALEKNEIDEMLMSLEELSPEDIAKIKAKLFVFEDIARLSDKARLLLFDGIDAPLIITALRGIDVQMKTLILEALSQRTRRMVEVELTNAGAPLTQAEIVQARRNIAQKAIRLSDQGIISLTNDPTANDQTANAP
ncbi:flagellar motor switch protein FliG [Bartonella sp. DGB2]|uniref:flagellar motor switch protein FliG n=1 Tax=Bartonella sp. DGB2 TaxID=3388426 RepID=UPI0039902366